MKFSEFMGNLFNQVAPVPKRMPLKTGRPWNVGQDGRVYRHPGVVVSPHYRQHVSGKTGKPCFQAVKGGKRPPVPTMVHRAVPLSVFKAKKNAIARKAMGRYVW